MKILIWSILAVGVADPVAATNEVLQLPPVEVTATVEHAVPPVAVTTLAREELAMAGIGAMTDVPLRVPNLFLSKSLARSFGDTYNLRGIGNTQNFSPPGVITYVDGAPAGSVFTYATELLDVDRIEVLRGPQGTVFGPNSAGGVINITTRQPDDFHASAEASYATFNTHTCRVTASGPILPGTLRLSLAGQYARSDGFLDNPAFEDRPDKSEGFSGRASVSCTPTDNWDAQFTATGDTARDGVRVVSLAGDAREVSSDIDPEANSNSNSQSLRVRRSFPKLTLSSITTRRFYNLDPLYFDLDLSAFPVATAYITRDETQWSQELRAESPAGARDWRWLAGFYFATRETDGRDERTILGFPMTTAFTLGEDNYALFGQLTRSQWDKLEVTMGARLDYTVKTIDRTKTMQTRLEDEAEYFTAAPKLTVGYRCTTNVLTYVSTGLGFKPGGYSAYINPPASAEYDPELNWANEIGVKTAWWDNKLHANVTLFWNHIRDYQVERTLANLIDQTVVNAPQVTSRGVELEVIGQPLTGLEFSVAAGYTDIQFDDFHDPDTGDDLSGNQPTGVPEFTATLAAQYKHRTGLFGRVEFQAVGRTFYDEANTDAFAQSSYGLLHARLGYEAQRWSVCVFGKNLTDTEYYSKKISELNAGVTGTPLTVGVLATVRY